MLSTRMQHRINADLKEKAESILEEQGIKPSTAITIFYTEITRTGGFPFLPSKVPNQALAKDLEKAEKGKSIKTYKNKKDLFNHLSKL
ncbi:MAG: type II toxin-antitoxin system RelB/DinJ family antitoxin [Candidatus Gracilibacteria bacterium]